MMWLLIHHLLTSTHLIGTIVFAASSGWHIARLGTPAIADAGPIKIPAEAAMTAKSFI